MKKYKRIIIFIIIAILSMLLFEKFIKYKGYPILEQKLLINYFIGSK